MVSGRIFSANGTLLTVVVDAVFAGCLAALLTSGDDVVVDDNDESDWNALELVDDGDPSFEWAAFDVFFAFFLAMAPEPTASVVVDVAVEFD